MSPLRVEEGNSNMDFQGFPKIPRYSRDCVVTEKIDGTNGQIFITEDGALIAGSKSRWLTTETDNFGFCRWAFDHGSELMKLGPGHHFGEWWGQGIQRNYGLKEKRFSLFNVIRWNEEFFNKYKIEAWESSKSKEPKPIFVPPPACCHVVPVIVEGMFETILIQTAIDDLAQYGSLAAPGFMNPEGIVIFHVAGNLMFKKTILKDEKPKGSKEE